MVTLENEFLKVSIRHQGAEMISVFNKENQTEHLWQADPSVWPWHAPNLFPVVGGCIDNQITVGGVSYPMQRHGFARQSEFHPVESDDTHAKFSLSHDQHTLEVYPYKFTFQVLYDLSDREIRITYKVINDDDQAIHFAVGAHPAFNVPFFPGESIADYYLEFQFNETLKTHLLSPEGFFTGETGTVPQQGNILPVTAELFEKDALVFKDLASRKVTIKSTQHSHSLEMLFPHFDYFGIWARDRVPFICLEPWIGCADSEGKRVELSQKEGIRTLDTGHVFEADFTIRVT